MRFFKVPPLHPDAYSQKPMIECMIAVQCWSLQSQNHTLSHGSLQLLLHHWEEAEIRGCNVWGVSGMRKGKCIHPPEKFLVTLVECAVAWSLCKMNWALLLNSCGCLLSARLKCLVAKFLVKSSVQSSSPSGLNEVRFCLFDNTEMLRKEWFLCWFEIANDSFPLTLRSTLYMPEICLGQIFWDKLSCIALSRQEKLSNEFQTTVLLGHLCNPKQYRKTPHVSRTPSLAPKIRYNSPPLIFVKFSNTKRQGECSQKHS